MVGAATTERERQMKKDKMTTYREVFKDKEDKELAEFMRDAVSQVAVLRDLLKNRGYEVFYCDITGEVTISKSVEI